MCDLDFDDLGLTRWDRRLLNTIVDLHSVIKLPKPDGWTRTKTGARYMVTPSGFVIAEDMSTGLIPKNMSSNILAVGRDDGLVAGRKHNEARRINYRVLRLLEIDWLWCVPKHYVTLRHRLLRKDCVMVRYRQDTDSFEWLGKDKLFFTVFSNNRLITREVIDERAARYFESAVRWRQRQGVGVDVGRGLG